MELQSHGSDKAISAQEALEKIKQGNRVFLGTGCGEPQHLIRTLIEETYPITEMAAAHARSATGRVRGKIAIEVS